jgi:hypothetical protein
VPYIINNSNGDSIVIPDDSLNQDLSIDLVGRNYANYGSIFAKTQVDLLDNFASTTAPSRSTNGQLWYDSTSKQIRVYDFTTGSWLPLGIQVSSSPLVNTNGQNKPGTAYFNTSEGQLFVHDGVSFKDSAVPGGAVSTSSSHAGVALGGTPSRYGSKIRHIFLTDENDIKRSVLALTYVNDIQHTGANFFQNEKLIAIFSGHSDTFVAKNEASSELGGSVTQNFYNQLLDSNNGIGTTINPGINVRRDDQGKVNFAETAERANAAYNLNTGSYSYDGTSDGANITASNVYHKNAHIISNQDDTYTLGSSSTVFSEGHIRELYVGNGTTGNIVVHTTSDVDIGTDSAPFSNVYVTNLKVFGDLETIGGGNIGQPDNRIENFYANVIHGNVLHLKGYTMPTNAGNKNDMLVLGGTVSPDTNTLRVAFKEQPKRLGDFTSSTITGASGNANPSVNFTETFTEDDDPANDITLRTYSYVLDVDPYYVRDTISIANTSNLSYDSANGIIDMTYTTPLDGYEPNDFVRIVTDQNINGHKQWFDRQSYHDDLYMMSERIYFGAEANADPNAPTQLTFYGVDDAYIRLHHNGVFETTNDIIGFATSDRRLKDDLKLIDAPLDKVCKLSGYTFVWNNNQDTYEVGKQDVGLVAQEVEEVLPEVVTERQNGYKAVNYEKVVPLLVESIKALKQEVEELKRRLGDN